MNEKRDLKTESKKVSGDQHGRRGRGQERPESIEKYRPSIDLAADKENDKRWGVCFLRGGDAPHPDLTYLLEENDPRKIEKAVSDFVDKFYADNFEVISDGLRQAKKEWSESEDYFYGQVDKMFKGYPWPRGNYRGYISVWHIYPRDIQDKSFTFPVKTREFERWAPVGAKDTIAHEMLHFITYDYLEKKYGLRPSECDDEDNFFWQFTENFNCLIENDEIWRPFKGDLPVPPKLECRGLYEKMKKIWDKNKDLDNLVQEVFRDRIRIAEGAEVL